MTGYSEETLIHIPSLCEVYGMDGFKWYCDKQTADSLFPRAAKQQSPNPLFVYLPNMTRAKLIRKGFTA